MKKRTEKHISLLPKHPALRALNSLLVVQLADCVRDAFNAYLADFDIHAKHFSILFLLAYQGVLSQAELSDYLNVDRAMMVRFIDHLEQLGWVQRSRNLQDRRLNAVTITEKGEAMLAKAMRFSEQTEKELFATLSEAERQQFNDLLSRLLPDE